MMHRRCLAAVVLLLLLMVPSMAVIGQKASPKNYFRSPVGFPITLSGSFGELRSNHLHSGIDIRTQGVSGKPVYAIADGYVSRVNVSPVGFGKALYINHPNGYTSLYGHLQSYAGPIATWVKGEHYKKESFAMDVEVPAGLLKVKKGDIVAYTGNSGSSGGPHLHFELRDTRTQEIIDPLSFGFMPPDKIPPRIAWLKVYPMDANSMVNFTNNPLLIPVTSDGGISSIKMADTIKVSGNISFGIEPSDMADGGLKTGIHSIELTVDGERIFSQTIERFAFSETRYANSLKDYPAFIQAKRKIQRSYVAPNNKLSVYNDVVNRGVVNFTDRRAHRIQYVVKDVFGNTNKLGFWVTSHPPASGRPKPLYAGDQLLTYKTDNIFERPGIKFEVPKEALYEELPFEYSVTGATGGSYAEVHHLHNNLTPLHTFCTLSVKAKGLPSDKTSKALIVKVSPGNKFSSVGGSYADGYVTTKIREFGNYTIAIDDIPPVVKPVNVFNNKKVSKQSTIQVKMSDNLAGIKTYRGTLNGRWILMDYDAKSSSLTYRFDDRMKPGKNRFVLVVTDGVGNSTRYEASLIR